MFHVSLLKQDITRKRREFLVSEFKLGDNKEYKVEAIQDNAVYVKEANGYLLGPYYLVA